jgi:DNA-binding NarL/FixJ family response regulator
LTVLRLALDGMTTRQIVTELGVGRSTVEAEKTAVRRAFGVESDLALGVAVCRWED